MTKTVQVPFTLEVHDNALQYCGHSCPHATHAQFNIGWCRHFRTQLKVDTATANCTGCGTKLKKEPEIFRHADCLAATGDNK